MKTAPERFLEAWVPTSAPLRTDAGRVRYVTASDNDCCEAFVALRRKEGIIPALEPAHAVALAPVSAREMGNGTVVVNLSSRSDKDMQYVIEY